MILIKVNPIGIWYWHRFKLSDGTLKLAETTKADYDQLKNPNFIIPEMAGTIWDSSFSNVKYDTVNGLLNEGEYAVLNPKYTMFKYKGLDISCRPMDIINNELVGLEPLKIVARLNLLKS